jgi:hypothetical protein
VKEGLFWWLQYLRIFALNSPWGTPVKFTIWIHAYEGQQLAEIWKITPIDVADGYGRKCQMIETKDKTITIQWVVVEPSGYGGPTATWGGSGRARLPE